MLVPETHGSGLSRWFGCLVGRFHLQRNPADLGSRPCAELDLQRRRGRRRSGKLPGLDHDLRGAVRAEDHQLEILVEGPVIRGGDDPIDHLELEWPGFLPQIVAGPQIVWPYLLWLGLQRPAVEGHRWCDGDQIEAGLQIREAHVLFVRLQLLGPGYCPRRGVLEFDTHRGPGKRDLVAGEVQDGGLDRYPTERLPRRLGWLVVKGRLLDQRIGRIRDGNGDFLMAWHEQPSVHPRFREPDPDPGDRLT